MIMYADRIKQPVKLPQTKQMYSYAALPWFPCAQSSAVEDRFSSAIIPAITQHLEYSQRNSSQQKNGKGKGNRDETVKKPSQPSPQKVSSSKASAVAGALSFAGKYSRCEIDHVMRVLITDGRVANSEKFRKSWMECWRKCSLVHIPGEKTSVRNMEEKAVASLKKIFLKEKSSEKKWVVMIMAGFYNIVDECGSAENVLDDLLDMKKAILQILPPGTIVVLGTVPGVYKKQLNDRMKLKMFDRVNDMITKENRRFNRDVAMILSDHAQKRFSLNINKSEITKMVQDIHKCFLHCTDLVMKRSPRSLRSIPAKALSGGIATSPSKSQVATSPPVRESTTGSSPVSKETDRVLEKSSSHCLADTRQVSCTRPEPAGKTDGNTQAEPKETKKKKEKNPTEITKIHEDRNHDVVHLSGRGGISTEKAAFVLASDNRMRNIRLSWSSEFPLIHILGKERTVRDLHKDFIKALTRLLETETLSNDRRLVVVVSAGSYNIVKGCHDADSIMVELLDLRDAIQRVLPPGAVTVISTFPCVSRKGSMKETLAKADKMFRQVNKLITDHYHRYLPAPAARILSEFDAKRLSLVLTKIEISKFVQPLEKCFKYFSAPGICSLCLVMSSKLSTSYTKGSFCMACDACLHQLSPAELAVGDDSDCHRIKDSENLQDPSHPGQEEDMIWHKIYQMQNYLKSKGALTMASLSDGLAGLLAVSFDKDLFVLYKKILKEEENGLRILSSCTYNDIAFLGITGERAVNFDLNRQVPEEHGNLLMNAAFIIRNNLQSLVASET